VDDNPGGPAGGNFTVTLLSGVQFVPLTRPSPRAAAAAPASNSTAPASWAAVPAQAAAANGRLQTAAAEGKRPCLPTPRWSPATHACFPAPFKRSALALLGLGHAQRAASHATSHAGSLPNALWLEVLAFTSRGWFDPLPSVEAKLATRLAIEAHARAEAEAAAALAQRRLKAAAKECAQYKALVQRLHAQLRAALEANQHPAGSTAAGSTAAGSAAAGGGPRRFGIVSNLLGGHLSSLFGHPTTHASAAAMAAAAEDDDDDDDEGESDASSVGEDGPFEAGMELAGVEEEEDGDDEGEEGFDDNAEGEGDGEDQDDDDDDDDDEEASSAGASGTPDLLHGPLAVSSAVHA
jgi:hypothetical protein